MRRLAALVLAGGLGLLGCGGRRGPCTPEVQAEIQARYSAQVLALCAKSPSLAACPAVPRLKQGRRKAQVEATCR